ncbi:hypothetical protein GCK32_021133 [Trichostrongylus colubriformis]|uniref:Uncharacterized protein n=1 Tax=Trichostrongylus colubriformis TaxID=6319 RepID=A0AAN8FFW0_TRICO
MILIFIAQMSILHQGQLLLKHLTASYDDSLSIGICSEQYVKNWHECSSLFLDAHCMAANTSFQFYAKGYCWKHPIKSFETGVSANLYAQ